MRIIRVCWLICLSTVWYWPTRAQINTIESEKLERLVDDLLPAQDLDLNYEDIYENLMQRWTNPLDLNTATLNDLRSLFLISEQQAKELIKHRDDTGPFLSIYELQTLSSFDSVTIQNILPFITIADTRYPASLLQRLIHEKNNYLIWRVERTLEQRRGFKTDIDSSVRYAGSPYKTYARFRTSRAGDFSLGFTAEKDAGEAFTWSPSNKQLGFDFVSFHFQSQNKGRLKNLIVGDFQGQFGQGLVLGGGFGMGKGGETIISMRRSNLGFMPYTSVNESNFFRGAAASISINKSLTLHTLASHVLRDARLSTTSEDEEQVSSLFNSGLHRTPAEVAARRKVGEANIAAVLEYTHQRLEAGALVHHTSFDATIRPRPRVYNGFAFSGGENTNVGMYANYTLGTTSLFSEAAYTMHKGWAAIAGVLMSVNRHFETAVVVRNYSKNYHAFYSNAIAENTLPVNEQGMYWGLKYTINKKYSFAGYADIFSFPWLRFRAYAPSQGYEWLARFNYIPSKTVSLFLQARAESKVRNLPTETQAYQTGAGLKTQYWLNANYAANTMLTFKTRLQYSTYQLDRFSQGFLVLQDVNLDLGRLSISGRYALFDTDNYDNRQYVYERDVWLAYSFPAYDGVGARRYLLIHYQLSKKLAFWLRWASIAYTDREEISSAGETIEGNQRNDLKFQVRFTF